MTTGDTGSEPSTLAPDDAFAVLGEETRLSILQSLGEADGPLAFGELRDRVGYDTAGNFSYHLDRLAGHFVEKTDDGYALRQAGRRVVEAILSGAVTEAPVLAPTQIDQCCQYCGAPVEASFQEERVIVTCTGCAGAYGDSVGTVGRPILGALPLPPAGVQGRTVGEILQAAYTWGGLDVMAVAGDVCPRCGATVDTSVRLCETHEADDSLCEACDRRFAVTLAIECTNCIYDERGAFGVALLANTELLAFITTHGVNPITPSSLSTWGAVIGDYDEEVLSTDPFEARFTFTIDDDALTLTVDDNLSVVDVTEHQGAASDR